MFDEIINWLENVKDLRVVLSNNKNFQNSAKKSLPKLVNY